MSKPKPRRILYTILVAIALLGSRSSSIKHTTLDDTAPLMFPLTKFSGDVSRIAGLTSQLPLQVSCFVYRSLRRCLKPTRYATCECLFFNIKALGALTLRSLCTVGK
jgi:hypothetical protein